MTQNAKNLMSAFEIPLLHISRALLPITLFWNSRSWHLRFWPSKWHKTELICLHKYDLNTHIWHFSSRMKHLLRTVIYEGQAHSQRLSRTLFLFKTFQAVKNLIEIPGLGKTCRNRYLLHTVTPLSVFHHWLCFTDGQSSVPGRTAVQFPDSISEHLDCILT